MITPLYQRNDLLYYEPRTTTSGPAMTWAIFAVNWLVLGNATKAEELFRQGYANVKEPFKVRWRG